MSYSPKNMVIVPVRYFRTRIVQPRPNKHIKKWAVRVNLKKPSRFSLKTIYCLFCFACFINLSTIGRVSNGTDATLTSRQKIYRIQLSVTTCDSEWRLVCISSVVKMVLLITSAKVNINNKLPLVLSACRASTVGNAALMVPVNSE